MSLKPFNLEVSNWSKELAASVQLYAHINYFNIKNSHWEPLVEPWNFKLELSRNPTVGNDVTHVKIISNNTLNLNITHTFLESAVSTVQMLDKQRDTVYSGERGTVAPYEIRNRTGYDITIWNSTNSNEGPTLKELKDGENIPWWFEDWRKRRETTDVTSNNLNVQIDGAQWRSLRDIQLDTEGEHIHALEPRLDNVQHHIVFDVKLANNIKVVTIRSSFVVENRTLLPVDLVSINPDGKTSSRIVKITPGEDYAIPIEQAYSHRFCIRPDEGFGYHWAQRAFHWRDFATPIKPPSALSCVSENREMPPFIFHVDARLDKKNILYGQYPAMAIKLSAPIEIENLLPYDFNFRIIDKTSGQDFSSFLRKGGVMPIHVIENGHLVLLSIEMPDTDYRKSDYAIISTKRTDDLDVDRSIELVHKNDKNNRLHIRINTMDVPGSGGAKRYSIFSPYIIMNKTWLPISFKEKHTWSDAFMSNSDNVVTCKPGPKPEPFMFSYPNMDNRNRTLIKVDKSDWSQPLSFEAVGSVYDVVLPNTNRSEEIHVGIHVQEGQGRFKLTRTITITPRFVLSNQMNQNIRYRVPETKDEYTLEAGQRIPLYNIRVQNEKQLSIKLEGFSNAWSAPFNIQDIGDVHVRLSNDYGEPDALIRVSVLLQDATIFIVLTKEASWPYLLVNKTDEDMIFYQEDPVLLRDDSTPVRNLRIKRYRLPAKQAVPYSWDLPAYKDKKMILSINGRERSINPQEIGTLPPFRHATRSGNPSITSIDIKIQGGRRVVELTPYRQSESQFKPVSGSLLRSSSMSSIDSAAREGFEVVDVDIKVNAVFQLQLREVGISLVDRQLQELAYITFRGIDLKLSDSTLPADLANKIFIHYSDQFIYQFHRILGSADFLGNPVGLFNTVSSGVAELFYEPWQGLIMSDRPQDLGYGIAKGFSGFIRKSVFGVSDSFTKFTGSIGKGLSAATMDREYQDRRRMNMSRNRPKHALVGVTQGATSFASSIASGFSGLVTRPVEGASKEGVGGFIKGFGKGLVGAVTKPAVGVFDFTSNISEGIRNTATPNDTNMIERARYPRYIGPDGILKPYSLRESIGQHWLKDVDGGKYMQDTYLAHCHVQNDERVAMLTNNRVMLIRTRRLAVEWQEPFSDIQTFKREPTGIIIYLRDQSPERFLIISDKHSREDFFKKIEGAVHKYNLTRRSAE
ncbi:hypothetical protein RMCBS344292_04619 [Rhizopus microsporus]|nr:hypothetical protein RMCBS344292_04619 [Rhizopus microsporus]